MATSNSPSAWALSNCRAPLVRHGFVAKSHCQFVAIGQVLTEQAAHCRGTALLDELHGNKARYGAYAQLQKQGCAASMTSAMNAYPSFGVPSYNHGMDIFFYFRVIFCQRIIPTCKQTTAAGAELLCTHPWSINFKHAGGTDRH